MIRKKASLSGGFCYWGSFVIGESFEMGWGKFCWRLYVEAEMHHITILYHIFFSFDA